ncbi:hypothetical protein [Devosia rhizoryzae]|uniref:Uncharacterized protein n=1 Tax=Devosia rhizoryzae TaxID=2774137 RepID=A0ABX7C721_9HYPH|nr:hypothetical protein [Devosia rhizoryzae]QQR40054.1 hypothetical protein JI748_03280 [Devosia rhizoryzae]
MRRDDPITAAPSPLLTQLVYRAGFDRNELELSLEDPNVKILLLPPGFDPDCFKVRDLGHMLEAYGLPYKIMARSKT